MEDLTAKLISRLNQKIDKLEKRVRENEENISGLILWVASLDFENRQLWKKVNGNESE